MYAWLDPQRMSYGFGYSSPWSLDGLVHLPAGASLRLIFAGRILGLRCSARLNHPQLQEEGRLRHQVVAMGVAYFHKQICLNAAPGMGRAQDTTEFSPQLWLCPCAGYASEGILAREQRQRGKQSQLPKVEVILAISPVLYGGTFPLQLHNVNSLLQTVYVYAVLGGGGPRWQPHNGADRHALLARC